MYILRIRDGPTFLQYDRSGWDLYLYSCVPMHAGVSVSMQGIVNKANYTPSNKENSPRNECNE